MVTLIKVDVFEWLFLSLDIKNSAVPCHKHELIHFHNNLLMFNLHKKVQFSSNICSSPHFNHDRLNLLNAPHLFTQFSSGKAYDGLRPYLFLQLLNC